MIPKASIDIQLSTSDTSEISRTYKISKNIIQGHVDGKEALLQAIDKILNTEKYEYSIYGFSYGIELENLISKDRLYVQMELMRRFKECLMRDERIQGVENFKFNISEESILCTFDVISIYGVTTLKKEVNI
jgi:hypothetical protein